MNSRIQLVSARLLASAPLRAAAIAASFLVGGFTLCGCNGAGQSEVTATDRPAEGPDWAVSEQMAENQGQ